MDRPLLIRKCLAIGIILIFLEVNVYPCMAKPMVNHGGSIPLQGLFFGLQTNINISWDENLTKEPIDLGSSRPKIPLNVSFWVTWGLLGRLINIFYSYRKLTVNFQVHGSEWSHYSSLLFDQLPVYVPPKENIQQITINQLTIDLDYFTPAYVKVPIEITAHIEGVIGPYGYRFLLRETYYTRTIYVMAQYHGGLAFNYPDGQQFQTPPLTPVTVPIKITNYGNAKTLVENEVYSPPGWNISLPSQVILDYDEEKEINITIMAPSDFSGYDTIEFGFVPHYYYNYSMMGGTYFSNIFVWYPPP